MKQQSPDMEALLNALRCAVEETLERKRRLGHYAVFWENGKVIVEGEDAPDIYRYPETQPDPIDEDRD